MFCLRVIGFLCFGGFLCLRIIFGNSAGSWFLGAFLQGFLRFVSRLFGILPFPKDDFCKLLGLDKDGKVLGFSSVNF